MNVVAESNESMNCKPHAVMVVQSNSSTSSLLVCIPWFPTICLECHFLSSENGSTFHGKLFGCIMILHTYLSLVLEIGLLLLLSLKQIGSFELQTCIASIFLSLSYKQWPGEHWCYFWLCSCCYGGWSNCYIIQASMNQISFFFKKQSIRCPFGSYWRRPFLHPLLLQGPTMECIILSS
jgi:hypothetical protein